MYNHFASHNTQIAARFSKAAASYDSAAALQREIGHDLMQLADIPTGILLDIGCGTGYFSRQWQQRGHSVIALDIAEGMLAVAAAQQSAECYVCADMESIPLPDNSVDTCFTSLAIQWSRNLPQVFRELTRITRPGGKILFATLLENTLSELRASWHAVDPNIDLDAHVNAFLSINQINIALAQAGISHHHLNFSTKKVMYPSVVALMRDLKAIGANHVHRERRSGLGGRRQLAELERHYREKFQQQAMLPASYDVCCGVIVNE
ncbi:malonyl-ACP O-methyltransferase BioC [Plesiomonas sp.]|uniref:malonyl-ACP O-methyltransferase BioC n=1 Tax=Plesiomonas sp. TaxID=2486279 RepID=UPI003F365EC8